MKDTEHEFDSWRSSSQIPHYQSQSQSVSHNVLQTQSQSQPQDYFHSQAYYPPPPPPPQQPQLQFHHNFEHQLTNQSSSQSLTNWSNGTGDPTMTFLSGYQPHDTQSHSTHNYMEAMFGSQNTYGFNHAFNQAFFPSQSTADPFWPSNKRSSIGIQSQYLQTRQTLDSEAAQQYGQQSAQYETYGTGIEGIVKHVQDGIQGLTLDHIKSSEQFSVNKSCFEPKNAANSSGAVGQSVGQTKKMTWASIASQPAKPQPKSLKSKMSSSALTGTTSKHLPPTSMEAIGTWEAKNGSAVKTPPTVAPPTVTNEVRQREATNQNRREVQSSATAQWTTDRTAVNDRQTVCPPQQNRIQQNRNFATTGHSTVSGTSGGQQSADVLPAHPVLDKLRVENNYNPKDFDLNPRNARFFIIKSYSEDDIHRSIKYSIWCSTEHGNKRLDNAFKQQESKGPIYLLYSVNGSGHFCGMAQMVSYVDYSSSSSVWAQDKWKGQFRVKWIYVKDVPNAQLRHIRLENNENKPVTNSRDTQEVPFEKGKQVIKIMHAFRNTTSIFDDFLHYEKRQEEESQRRDVPTGVSTNAPPSQPPDPRANVRPQPPPEVTEQNRKRNWNKN